MIHRKVVLPSGLAMLLLLAGGCRKQEDPSAIRGAKPRATPVSHAKTKGLVALSVLTMDNPFFKVIADHMEAELAKHGYGLLAVSGDFDVAKQQNQVKDFIVKKVSAIVLNPCDSRSIGPAIKEANDAGIPVFTCDIAALTTGVEVICHVATDNYQGGRLAAQAMVEALDGKGEVAILDHPEVESVILRTRGFHDELAEQNQRPDVDVRVVVTLPGGAAREKSFSAAQDLMQSHPEIDGIFAINDPTALGAVAAYEKAGKLDQVKMIGFDGQPAGKQAIKEGKIYADPIQFPDQIGVKTAQAVIRHFEGEKLPPEILIPTALYRKADAEKDPELKD